MSGFEGKDSLYGFKPRLVVDTPENRADDQNFETALEANKIMDYALERFSPSGDIKRDAELLKEKLISGGINFKGMGRRTARETEKFIGKILRLTVNEMEEAKTDYKINTINAIEELSEELLAEPPMKDVVRRAA